MARIDDLLRAGQSLSIELWPPRNDVASGRLDATLERLKALRPTFASITYGAAGSTRDRTHDLVVSLQRAGWTTPMAHLTTAAHRRDELVDILTRYRDAGVENVLALRGDRPLNSDQNLPGGELAHAEELVELTQSIAPFCVAVAAHPEGHPDEPDRALERRRLADKMRRADFAISQFFFRIEDYKSLVEDLSALGIDKPVLPGIMPISNVRSLERMAQLSGCVIPSAIVDRVRAVADDPGEVQKIGIEVATEMGAKLLAEGVPGLHFYTMNQANATFEICANLNLVPSP